MCIMVENIDIRSANVVHKFRTVSRPLLFGLTEFTPPLVGILFACIVCVGYVVWLFQIGCFQLVLVLPANHIRTAN
jgi:hypothetical protein